MILQVSYTLNKTKDYEAVYKVLKSANSWCHAMTSHWFIQVNGFDSVESWYSKIKAAMDADDHVFVIDISNPVRNGTYQGWLPHTVWDWLKQHAYAY